MVFKGTCDALSAAATWTLGVPSFCVIQDHPGISRVSLGDTAGVGYTPVRAISRPEFTASVKA
jgi:hypothetical protein